MTRITQQTNALAMPCRQFDLRGLLVVKIDRFAGVIEDRRHAPSQVAIDPLEVFARVIWISHARASMDQGRRDLCILQQWIIDFIPIWMGFDSWLTPATAPIYLALNTVIMFWVALTWGRHKANRYMTFGLKPASRPVSERPAAMSTTAGTGAAPLSQSPSQWADSRVLLFASVVILVVALNILALENAPKLTPAKLSLVPTNPYPWAPAKVADHH